MTCYEYSKSSKKIGKFYIYSSIIGIPITLYFLSSSNLLFAIVAKFILLGMFVLLALIGLVYVFFRGSWYFKIDNTHFEYKTPFGESNCFKVQLKEIEKLEIQQSKSVDSTYYYVHLKNNQKHQLDTESLVKMTEIIRCLKEASVIIDYSTSN